MKKDAHVHVWEDTVKVVLPHKKSIKDFRDTLKQRKCKCGKVETYDLERKVI